MPLAETLAAGLVGIVAGQTIGDLLGATGATPGPVIAATSAAAKPANAKGVKTAPESTGQIDAKQSLLLAAFLVVLALAILGFGSQALKNVRIA